MGCISKYATHLETEMRKGVAVPRTFPFYSLSSIKKNKKTNEYMFAIISKYKIKGEKKYELISMKISHSI